MPLVSHSSYQPPLLFKNPHLQTIFANRVRPIGRLPYIRERISTPDLDFLDLDWVKQGSQKLLILTHGVEGSSLEYHVIGMAKAFLGQGFDILAWNHRGCSEEPNLLARAYHMGSSDDLYTVIQHVSQTTSYASIVLIGFSLGGNVTLKYLGESSDHIPSNIQCAVLFSTPCHIYSSISAVSTQKNQIYHHLFMRSLIRKFKQKALRHPNQLSTECLFEISNFTEFDRLLTAPLNGFSSSEEYWQQASSIPYLPRVNIPSLIINAEDDPLLSPVSSPKDIAKNHPHLYLEIPKHGGHCGFVSFASNGIYWSEKRAIEFVSNILQQ